MTPSLSLQEAPHQSGDAHQTGINLFPYTMIRVGGLSFDLLQPMALQQCLSLCEGLDQAERDLDLAREGLCQVLYECIQGNGEGKRQKKLLNIKRDLSRGRSLQEPKIQFLRETLEDASALQGYLQALSRCEQLETRAEAAFESEVAQARQHLRDYAALETLRKGLTLSSKSLLEALDTYRAKADSEMRKADYKTEISILKYLTRICTKTSPFSSFTPLAVAKLVPQKEPLLRHREGDLAVKSHFRINNILFGYLKSLVQSHPAYRAQLDVIPNPTITSETDAFEFLTNCRNIESFQRLANQPVLSLLIELVHQKNGLTYEGLLNRARTHVDADRDALSAYLDQLLNAGFLEFDFGVSGLDPDWDLSLAAWLGQRPECLPLRQDFIQMLEYLRAQAALLATEPAASRKTILQQAFACVKAFCMKFHEDAGLPEEERMAPAEAKIYLEQKQAAIEAEIERTPEDPSPEAPASKAPIFRHFSGTYFHFKPKQIFFEDCTLDLGFQMSRDTVAEVTRAFSHLYQRVAPFLGDPEEQDRMTQHFKRLAARNSKEDKIGLLRFYETYYREVKKPVRPNADKDRQPPSADDSKAKIHFLSQLKDGLERSEVDRAVYPLEPSLLQTCLGAPVRPLEVNAHGAFVQCFLDRSQPSKPRVKAVMNALPHGYGKFFSRFLHIFDTAVTQHFRKWNLGLFKNTLMAENCDASMFNANLHPPLMPFEIRMPGSHNALGMDRQIPVTQIQVCLAEDRQQLQLIHRPSGKRLFVFDLGFVARAGRSELFNLLKKFSPAHSYNLFPILFAINDHFQKLDQSPDNQDGIQQLPRITYQDVLILQRKAWKVPRALLPQMEPSERQWQWYRRIRAWQKALGIPDHVFISAANRSETQDNRFRVGRDDYKPQYLSFKNPLTLRILQKVMPKVPHTLTITEMLPAPEHLIHIQGRPFVTEFILEWQTPQSGNEEA